MICKGCMHFRFKALDDLQFQWYGLPSVAGMMLEVGGLQFPASPFGGWYSSIEIIRNMLEPHRYDLMEVDKNRLSGLIECENQDLKINYKFID